MSLINDALKKAQRQRAGDSASQTSVDPTGRSATPREQSSSKHAMLLIVCGAGVLIVLSVLVTVYLLRPGNHLDDSSPALASAAVSTPESAPQLIAPEDTPSPVIAMPVITAPAPQIETPPVNPAPTVVIAPPPEVIEPTRPEPVPVEPAVNLQEEIHKFLDQIQIAGIRAAGSESKVLMNNQVYRLNDIVNRELGLRLLQVDSTSLVFTDANGTRYPKKL